MRLTADDACMMRHPGRAYAISYQSTADDAAVEELEVQLEPLRGRGRARVRARRRARARGGGGDEVLDAALEVQRA